MYDTEALETLATGPMLRLRCPTAGEWLPLTQDWSERWCTLPQLYVDRNCERIGAFETRADDVFVVTFMKCGTTWMQELAWLLLNKLDYEGSKQSYVMERSKFLEYSAMGAMVDKDSITACNNMSSPRLIKSHLPAQLLPPEVWLKKRKIIYVARNVKDVVVSSFNFVRGLNMWNGSIAQFVDEFINNKIAYTSFWAHIVDFWRMRNEPNIFFVTYEEMKKDLESVVKRLCIFLEINELSKLEMKELLHHLSFDNMKAHQYTNLTGLLKQSYEINENFDFMRRGIVGSFKDELSDDHRKKLDKWTNDILQQYGIKESDIFGDF